MLTSNAFAQRPNVDTLSINGITTTMPSNSVPVLSKFDTMFWNPTLGVGMLRKDDRYYNHKGEYRVGVQNANIEQVTFAIGAKNKEEAIKIFNDVAAQLKSNFGEPDNSVTVGDLEIRWEGVKQFFALRMAPSNNAVNIVLSKFDQK